jgi:hypothetical protein
VCNTHIEWAKAAPAGSAAAIRTADVGENKPRAAPNAAAVHKKRQRFDLRALHTYYYFSRRAW